MPNCIRRLGFLLLVWVRLVRPVRPCRTPIAPFVRVTVPLSLFLTAAQLLIVTVIILPEWNNTEETLFDWLYNIYLDG